MQWCMDAAADKEVQLQGIIASALRGALSQAQARRLHRLGPEAVTLAMLATAKRIAEQSTQLAKQSTQLAKQSTQITEQNARIDELQSKLRAAQQISPSTPSGQVPIYAKPKTPKRKGNPGAQKGHKGVRRAPPERIDDRKTHRLPRCPHCGGRLQRCQRTRTRIIEDIPDDIQPVATEHTIHRDYCPRCKQHVEPVVPDALPGATLGHRVVSLTSWLHYGLGVTIDQITEILSYHLQTRITPGGLVQAWQRLAEVLVAWYEQIGEQAKASAKLHADETGWRVNGQTHWLWCFANEQVCYYMIDRCRGSPALKRFFDEAFAGVLITDFWAAYGSVEAEDRQYCLTHLLRELEKVDQRNDSVVWRGFAKKLRRLVADGIRLRKRPDFTPQRYARRAGGLTQRLCVLANASYRDKDAARLAARLRRHAEFIFAFLDYPDVPYDNNLAERQIRPAVILRKNSQSNRSQRGAATQAILMSVYQTLKLRGHPPTDVIVEALRTYLSTSQLPPLPA
jgi:transposase